MENLPAIFIQKHKDSDRFEMYTPANADEAIQLNAAIDIKYAELALYKGFILTTIKRNEYWKGRAETFGSFLNDKTFNSIGQSQSEKYMRLYVHYVEKLKISPQDINGVSLDNLDKCKKIIKKKEDFDERKDLLKLRTKDLNESIKEITGDYAPNESKIGQWVSFWMSFTDEEKQLAMEKSGLNHFRFQKKCVKCGQFFNLDEHHDAVKRSHGGKAWIYGEDGKLLANIAYLCDKCHDLVERGLTDI